MKTLALLPLALLTALGAAGGQPASRPPNLLFFLADDLGSAELGCYGQRKIRTPNIDRLAAEGMRWTRFYSGSPVCAPCRCTLMTGKHTGHATIRDNRELQPEGQAPLSVSDVTIAEVLKEKGYATAAIGKWGLGPPGSDGDPNRQGFDLFFGYNCQRHAHNYYPSYLRRNGEVVNLEGNSNGLTGKQYAPDLMEAEALRFLREHKGRPFFLYYPTTVPHLALQVPDDSLAEYLGRWDDPPYDGKSGYLPNAHPRATYAAMVTRMDRSVGRILALLKELGLEENTLVLFASDNGPTYDRLGGSDSEFFQSAGILRGLKGSVYEGGIRVPLIARWPGRIRPGTTSDVPVAMWDLFPTLCAAAGARAPSGLDGVSLLPNLLGQGGPPARDYLYWEFASCGGQQAVQLTGDGKGPEWKGIRQNLTRGRTGIELYDLAVDPAEQNDVADAHPEVVARIAGLMEAAHVPSTTFPLPGLDAAGN